MTTRLKDYLTCYAFARFRLVDISQNLATSLIQPISHASQTASSKQSHGDQITHMLPPRLLVIHNPGRRSKDDLPERACRKQRVNPVLNYPSLSSGTVLEVMETGDETHCHLRKH